MAMNGLARLVPGAALAALLIAPAWAQSLDPKAPAPLGPGANSGTVDSMVGAQYWSFKYRAGDAKIGIHFTSMSLLGKPMRATVEVVLLSGDAKVVASHALTSNGQIVSLEWSGTFPAPGTATVELRPDSTSLIRTGGDYTITVAGSALDFAAVAPPGPGRIAGTYSVMACPADFDCRASLAVRFLANGTVETTDGHKGTWKAFDPDALVYLVIIGADRWSLKLVPGRGLFNTSDLSAIVFQAVR